MEQKVKRREWVKTAAIVFLSVLLILTFFSNTIMNRSLPEVATQVVQSGSINAQIRGNGTISAEETYDVTISQSRKVQSVKARVGDEVKTGDVLFVLDPAESSELQAARDTLASMELAYQQSLISASNSAAQENRQIQKLRQSYNEALANYQLYSSMDPAKLKSQLSEAEAALKERNRNADDMQSALNDAQTDEKYLEYKAEYDANKTEIDALTAKIEQNAEGDRQVEEAKKQVTAAENNLKTDQLIYQKDFELLFNYAQFYEYTQKWKQNPGADFPKQVAYSEIKKKAENGNTDANSILNRMSAYTRQTDMLKADIAQIQSMFSTEETGDPDQPISVDDSSVDDSVTGLSSAEQSKLKDAWTKDWKLPDDLPDQTTCSAFVEAYQVLTEDEKSLESAEKLRDDLLAANSTEADKDKRAQLSARQNALYPFISNTEYRIEQLKNLYKQAKQQAEDQQELVSRLQDAQSAAQTLTAAKEALEDATFNLSLGDADALRLQKDKEDIEKQKELITELEEKSDAVEVKARVSGVISAVNITAGNTANAETPLATITIKDRGYTVRISCTADQSRRVTIGDQAKLSNYYSGGVTATLEKIIPDPQNPQTGRFLVFRLTGEGVQPGSNVTLAIGQKSATYEALIPNSALRSDTNGNYVLVVVEKSNALSTRYTARRVDVTVLASDDTQTAVVGLSPGDFVITTSNRPIEAGAQVRLPDAS